MPVITIEILPLEYEKKAEIAKVFTEELIRIAGIPKEPIVLLFHDLTPEHAATAGKMLKEQFNRDQSK